MLIFTSFKDVIENVYGADILNSVDEYLESNSDRLAGILILLILLFFFLISSWDFLSFKPIL